MRHRNRLPVPPWWAALLLAAVSYVVLAEVFPRWPTPNPYVRRVLTSVAPALAPVVAVGFTVMAAALGLARWRRRRLLDRHRTLDALRAMRWQDFERWVGEFYRRQGWRVQDTGGGGADGGIDLILRRNGETWLVQCKRFAQSAISVKTVRELLGVVASEKATGGVFVTTSTFTRDARAFAKGQTLELVDGETLLQRVKAVHAEKSAPLTPESTQPLTAAVEITTGAALQPTMPTESLIVHCPHCGGRMMRRTAKQGGRAGQTFWGCSAYPACRGTRPI